MHALLCLYFLFSLVPTAHALVSSQAQGNEGDWKVELRTTFERGKVEPNENTASFQRARINIYDVSASRFFGSSFGSNHFLKAQIRAFTSAREEVAGQLFHEEDFGQALSLTYGLDIVHELRYFLSAYFSATPFARFNKAKFSQPRIDRGGAGVQLGIGVSESFTAETLLHFGLGFPRQQNSYLALSQVAGWKLEQAAGWPVTLKLGPYVEMDLQDRFDNKYDSAFSPSGRSDRIRAAKFGILGGLDFSLGADFYGQISYVQKIGGYDAAATNATSLGMGRTF